MADYRTLYDERLPKPDEVATITWTPLSADGVKIKGFKDHKTILVIKGSGNVTVVAGNSGFARRDDLTFTPSANGSMLTIESAKYMDKATGEVTIKGTSNASIAVLEAR